MWSIATVLVLLRDTTDGKLKGSQNRVIQGNQLWSC